MKRILLFIFVWTMAMSYSAQASDASIDIEPSVANPHKISNYLNGVFIEFLMDYINGPMGLWSQEIQDRGFEEINSPNQVNEIFYHWRRYGDNSNKTNVKITAGGYNKSDRYQLQMSETADMTVGLYQQIWLNDTVSHEFYIYTKSENAIGTAKIALFDTLNQTVLFEKEIDINHSDWKKIKFEIPAIAGCHTFNFAITYQGIGTVCFDEVSIMPTNNFHGMRKEWADYFRILKPGVLRYPGGCFSDITECKWEYFTGDIDQRKSAIYFANDLHNEYTQRVDFGIDECVKVCRALNIEPVLVLNFTQDAVHEANFIEYCNADTSTVYGKLRAKHSQIEPYNIKVWEITNELYTNYSAEELAQKMSIYADEMRKRDSSIFIVGNGNGFANNYMETFIDKLGDKIDCYGIHIPSNVRPSDITDNEKWYLQMQATANHYKSVFAHYDTLLQSSNPNCKFSCNEWWTEYADNIQERNVDTNWRNISMESSLWSANMYLNFISHPKTMSYCAKTLGIGYFRRWIYPDGRKTLYVSPSLFAIDLLSKQRGEYVVKNSVTCNTYEDFNTPGYWIPTTPYLDVTTTISDDTLFIAVINRSLTDAINTNVKIRNGKLLSQHKLYEFTSDHYLDYPTADNPNKIKVVEKDLILDLSDSNSFDYDFPKHSVTVIAAYGDYDTDIGNFPNNEINIYPNPTTQNLTITLDIARHINNIDIYDISGKLVYNNKYNFFSNKIILNELNLAKGAYRMTINCSNGVYNKSLMIE